MIKIDGTAIPLEPGKHYLLLYDANVVSTLAIESLYEWANANGIEIALLSVPSGQPNAVRLIDIEKPETPA